ncbi:MAG: response regulator transcription factor [Bacteroidales bacterium]|nr:response regulator transcription factor [Bacteroidales bacterium]
MATLAANNQRTEMPHFIVADNQELTRFGVERLLAEQVGAVVRYAHTRAELLEQLQHHPQSVVVLDYKLFDFANEDDLMDTGRQFPQSRWVLLSDRLSIKFLRRIAYETQSMGVVFKDASLQALRAGLQYALKQERYLCHQVTELLLDLQRRELEQGATDDLTATEVDILRCIAQGKTTRQIANERFLSRHTVNTHRKNIFRKLSVRTAHDATVQAIKTGILDISIYR